MTIDVERQSGREWLEADGLGGFAMGTVSGVRTRRYHGLLQVARRPPAERTMLVNAVEAWVDVGDARIALSSHGFAPGVVHPDGWTRIEHFSSDPWPTWVLVLPDGSRIVHEVFVPHGHAAVALSWRREGGTPGPIRLVLRPFISGRDFHSLQRRNDGFRAHPTFDTGRIELRPYADQPAITLLAEGRYVHDPVWYERFLYAEERARGLDFEEDLLAPGTIELDLAPGATAALLCFAPELAPELAVDRRPASAVHAELAARERARRATFATPLDRAADAYLVARGTGRTIIAGYPWFGDWGRDTFIALRGICLATNRLDEAGAILDEWATAVSEGMLPNRFPDRGETPEHNAVDASLWYVVAVAEYLALRRGAVERNERARLVEACLAIVRGYDAGTRYGIRCDPLDGLIACGVPGVQLTWMDAKVGDRVITPRIGKPIEIQALWLNALAFTKEQDTSFEPTFRRALASIVKRYTIAARPWLADVADVDHIPGAVDASLRPNQVFAIGGLPFAPIEGPAARRALDAVEHALWTPVGLRTLAPDDPAYRPRYEGGVWERDSAYHQGTVWPWPLGPFVEAWLRLRGNTSDARVEARSRFLIPLEAHLDEAGIGHVSEIFDAEPPHTPRGCPFQAWSVGELVRLRALLAPGR